MAMIETKDGTTLYYNDWGTGQPIVFSHGWPLSADAFEDQMFFLASRGYRCIAHDRRGLSIGGGEIARYIARHSTSAWRRQR
jgi:non-heme chloroperoxidase